MNSKKDLDEFMKKYNETLEYSLPKFMVLPFIENKFNEMNKIGIQLNQTMVMNPYGNKNFPIQPNVNVPYFQKMPQISKKI
jgi:hypothetical protein